MELEEEIDEYLFENKDELNYLKQKLLIGNRLLIILT